MSDQETSTVFKLLSDRLSLQDRTLRDRLDAQDSLLREIRADLKEVRVQTTRTNGRVTALEQVNAIDKALHDDGEKRVSSRRWRYEFIIGSLCILLGGAVNELAHLVGG